MTKQICFMSSFRGDFSLEVSPPRTFCPLSVVSLCSVPLFSQSRDKFSSYHFNATTLVHLFPDGMLLSEPEHSFVLAYF